MASQSPPGRNPEHDILPLFHRRWSPRAFSGEGLSEGEMKCLFEAARWAPSSYNAQPWRFLYALRNDEHWETYLDFLVEFNRLWARAAGALVLVLGRTLSEKHGTPSATYAFDVGLATQNLLLQATHQGLSTHPMGGFDAEAARRELEIPEHFAPLAMIAVGRKGDKDDLPDRLAALEVPSQRKELKAIAWRGVLGDG